MLAVARKLKAAKPDTRVIAVIDKTTKFGHLLEDAPDIDMLYRVSAGKLRRYPNQSLAETLLDFKTMYLNIVDGFKTLAGLYQAFRVLHQTKPNIIFIKGGFVSVPVGIAAHIRRVPFITHDSDAEPSLTNKIIGRWARLHLVGLPQDSYSYSKERTVQVGIPVVESFKRVTDGLKKAYRKDISVPANAKLILVTGGSQGSMAINTIIGKIVPILAKHEDIYVIHQTGVNIEGLPEDTTHYLKVAYIADMPAYSGAADVVVTRSGSFMAELAVQEKAAIAIPGPHLAGGHQVKNAQYLRKHKAAIVFEESALLKDPSKLAKEIETLLNDTEKRRELGRKLSTLYPPDASERIASVLMSELQKV